MFDYTAIFAVTAIFVISLACLIYSYYVRQFTIFRITFYFTYYFFHLDLNLFYFYFDYFENDFFIFIIYIVEILIFFNVKEKIAFKGFYISILISNLLFYGQYSSLIGKLLFPDLEYIINDYMFGIILFSFLIVPIAVIWLTIDSFKPHFIFSVSAVFFIFMPLTSFIVFDFLNINLNIFKNKTTLKEQQEINGIMLPAGSIIYNLSYSPNKIVEILPNRETNISWHNLNIFDIKSYYRTSAGMRTKVQALGYLDIYSIDDYLIHNRLCDSGPIKFRFLSDNHQDWSEKNTEFMSCELQKDSPLNQMKILPDLGNRITLTYKPLINNPRQHHKLHTLGPSVLEIVWHWDIDKKISIYDQVLSAITDLYLDNKRNLITARITNLVLSSTVSIDNCVFTREEFSTMLISGYHNDKVLFTLPDVSPKNPCYNRPITVKRSTIFAL